MKTVKKIATIVCACGLVASVCACSSSAPKPSEPIPVETSAGAEVSTQEAVPGGDMEPSIIIENGDAEGIQDLAKKASSFEIEEGTVVQIYGTYSSGITVPAIQEEAEDGNRVGINLYVDGDWDEPLDGEALSVTGVFKKGQYFMEFHADPENILIMEPETDEGPGSISGGWSKAEDATDVTDDLRAVFDEAVEGMVGAEYAPVKYVGSQIVNGTNHCFLAEISPVVPNPESHFGLVYIHEGLDGSVELVNVYDLDIADIDEFDEIADQYGDYFDYEKAADEK